MTFNLSNIDVPRLFTREQMVAWDHIFRNRFTPKERQSIVLKFYEQAIQSFEGGALDSIDPKLHQTREDFYLAMQAASWGLHNIATRDLRLPVQPDPNAGLYREGAIEEVLGEMVERKRREPDVQEQWRRVSEGVRKILRHEDFESFMQQACLSVVANKNLKKFEERRTRAVEAGEEGLKTIVYD